MAPDWFHVNSFPGFAPFVRGTRASGYVKQPWDVAQDVISSSAAEFNQSARTMATHGVSALNMPLESARWRVDTRRSWSNCATN